MQLSLQFKKGAFLDNFTTLEGELWRQIPGTKCFAKLSNYGRVCRWSEFGFFIVEPTKNSYREVGLNLPIRVQNPLIKMGTYKFIKMQRLMAYVWLSEGYKDFRVTHGEGWQLDDIKIHYRDKKMWWLGVDGSLLRKLSKSKIGVDIDTSEF